MEDKNICPHIKLVGLPYCVTEGMTYLPTPRRLRGYCNNRMHKDCDLYMAVRDKLRVFSNCDT